MLNNFASRATVPVTITITGFVIVCCLDLYSFIKTDLVNDTIYHEAILADTIIKATRYGMIKSDPESIDQIISNIGQQDGVDHVRIFGCEGTIMFSAVPGERHQTIDKKGSGCITCHSGPEPASNLGPMEKARQYTNEQDQAIIAITAPIYNEPACFESRCHYHPSDKKILGILDVGLSQETLETTLGTLRIRMIIFCVMILILSVGGVSALLRKFVLSPVRQLTVFVDQVSKGNFDYPLPRGDKEIESLARIFLDIAVQGDKIKSRPGESEDQGEEGES